MGKWLVRETPEGPRACLITEVEAYDGPEDRASHASRGETDRNAPMFGEAGRWYVYLCYGMHWMVNVVTGPVGYPAAVLLRGAGDLVGPGRLTKGLGISGEQNGQRAGRAGGLWIEDRGTEIRRAWIRRAPRVGVDYAGAWARRPYRFILAPPKDFFDNQGVSEYNDKRR